MSVLAVFAVGLLVIITLGTTAVLISDAIERGHITRWAKARANRLRRRSGDRA